MDSNHQNTATCKMSKFLFQRVVSPHLFPISPFNRGLFEKLQKVMVSNQSLFRKTEINTHKRAPPHIACTLQSLRRTTSRLESAMEHRQAPRYESHCFVRSAS